MDSWVEAYEEHAEAWRENVAADAERRRKERHARDIAHAREEAADLAVTMVARREARAFMDRSLHHLMQAREQAVIDALRPQFSKLPEEMIRRHADELLHRSMPQARYQRDAFVSSKEAVANVVTITLPSVHYRFMVQTND